MDMLLEYVRCPKTRRRRGVLVGLKDEEMGFLVGFSACNPRDKFDRELGKTIAVGRARAKVEPKVPGFMRSSLEKFRERCRRYFKVEQATKQTQPNEVEKLLMEMAAKADRP